MRTIIIFIGVACILCCASLAFTALSAIAQPGKLISDAQAATLRGGCDVITWQNCDPSECSGQVDEFSQSGGTQVANGHVIYCCSSGTASCSNGANDCQ